jgi:hypothetical protein
LVICKHVTWFELNIDSIKPVWTDNS